MSLYLSLSSTVPDIALSIFHYAESSGPKDDHLAALRDFHRKAEEECEAVRQLYLKSLSEAIARESHVLRGSLSQYLSTPIKSDAADVLRIISESLQQMLQQSGSLPPGLVSSWAGHVVFPETEKVAGKKLIQNGKAFLRDAGIGPGRQKDEVFESVFLLSGGMNLDLLEFVMREQLGDHPLSPPARNPARSRHLSFSYGTLLDSGSLPKKQVREGRFECLLLIAGIGKDDRELREGCQVVRDDLVPRVGATYLVISRRRLGSAVADGLMLRCVVEDMANCQAFIDWACEERNGTVLADTAGVEGKLLIKEFVC